MGGGLVLVLVEVRSVCCTEPRRIPLPPGQAQGPRIRPTLPLVPTGRDGAHSRIRSSKFIRDKGWMRVWVGALSLQVWWGILILRGKLILI
jgi:hypothetical protein